MKNVVVVIILTILWSLLFLGIGNLTGYLTIKAVPWQIDSAMFLYRHLRLSIIPFCLLLLLYSYLVVRIRWLLSRMVSPARIYFHERLLNATISTFFGVGVIWTAIGMESALLQALEGVKENQTAAAGMDPGELLASLVNGGLLLALSTTVFGGVCGYLLRLLKIGLLGAEWDRFVLGEVQNDVSLSQSLDKQ